MKLATAIMFMTLACGAAAPEAPVEEPVLVSYTLSPDQDIFGFTQRAVYRWNAARGCSEGSGCELTIGEDAIPVQYVPEIPMPELDAQGLSRFAGGASKPLPPGTAGCDWEYVHVSLRSNDPQRTLMHELGHVLGITEHTTTGVTADLRDVTSEEAKAFDAWNITEEVLTAVCSQTVCLEFNPE